MSLTLESLMPEISWPAITGDESAQLMALLYQLDQSQHWSPADIEKAQFSQLDSLVSHAATHSPFYHALYHDKKHLFSTHFDKDSWQQLPVVSRSELQLADKNARCNQLPDYHQVIGTIATSGSTGQPLSIDKTNISQLYWRAVTLRDHIWHDVDIEKTLLIIRVPKGKQIGHDIIKSNAWGDPVNLIGPTGKSLFVSVDLTVSKQFDLLIESECHYLLTYPTNLAALIRESINRGIKPKFIKSVRTLGEIVSTELRQLCREYWQVDIVDSYSCQEVGYIALQCPKHAHYHVQSETVKVEILDDNNQACKPGETGKVVITCLHNFANPIIRYEIGDYATLGETCNCGINLPVLSKIHGRTRNMLRYPNGDSAWPNINDRDFYSVNGLKQFQIIQTTVEQLEFHFVASDLFKDEQRQQCQSILDACLHHSFDILFIAKESIHRSKGSKHEDFKSLII